MSGDIHDDLLASLRAVGTVEDEGAISVDFDQARARMRDYLLPQPHFWVLEVMQHAAAAEADHVAVTARAGRVRIFHDGRTPTPAELSSIFGQMFFDGGNRSLPPLAIALNAALALPDAEVWISTWDGPQAHVLHATTSGMQVQTAHVPHAAGRGLVFDLRSRAGLLQRLGGTAEADLLRERCLFVPFHLAVDNQQIAPADFGEARAYTALYPSWRLVGVDAFFHPLKRYFPKRHHALEARFWSEETRDGVIGLLPASLATCTVDARWGSDAVLDEDGPDPRRARHLRRCRAALALRADIAAPSEVVVVVRGVRTGVLHLDDVSGLYGAVAADGHATDLSGLTLQETAAEVLSAQVRREAARMDALLAARTQGTTRAVRVGQLLTGEGMRR